MSIEDSRKEKEIKNDKKKTQGLFYQLYSRLFKIKESVICKMENTREKHQR